MSIITQTFLWWLVCAISDLTSFELIQVCSQLGTQLGQQQLHQDIQQVLIGSRFLQCLEYFYYTMAGVLLSNKALKCIWNVLKQLLLCSLFCLLTLCFASDSSWWRQYPIGPKSIPEGIDVVNQHLLTEYPVHCIPDLFVDGSSKSDLNESN